MGELTPLDGNTWYGRVYMWYLDRGGVYSPNLCPTVRAIGLTTLLEVGFWTKRRLVRPITVIILIVGMLLSAVGYRATQNPSMQLFWVLFLVNMVASLVIWVRTETDKYGNEHLGLGMVGRLVLFPFAAVFALPFFVAWKLLGWLFKILGLLFARPLLATLNLIEKVGGWTLGVLGDFLGFNILGPIRIWHLVLFALWGYCVFLWPSVFTWTYRVLAVVAVAILLIAMVVSAVKAVYKATEPLQERARAAKRKANMTAPKKKQGMTTWQVVAAYFKAVHHKICPQISWVNLAGHESERS